MARIFSIELTDFTQYKSSLVSYTFLGIFLFFGSIAKWLEVFDQSLVVFQNTEDNIWS
jgi:hypothetical protein